MGSNSFHRVQIHKSKGQSLKRLAGHDETIESFEDVLVLLMKTT